MDEFRFDIETYLNVVQQLQVGQNTPENIEYINRFEKNFENYSICLQIIERNENIQMKCQACLSISRIIRTYPRIVQLEHIFEIENILFPFIEAYLTNKSSQIHAFISLYSDLIVAGLKKDKNQILGLFYTKFCQPLENSPNIDLNYLSLLSLLLKSIKDSSKTGNYVEDLAIPIKDINILPKIYHLLNEYCENPQKPDNILISLLDFIFSVFRVISTEEVNNAFDDEIKILTIQNETFPDLPILLQIISTIYHQNGNSNVQNLCLHCILRIISKYNSNDNKLQIHNYGNVVASLFTEYNTLSIENIHLVWCILYKFASISLLEDLLLFSEDFMRTIVSNSISLFSQQFIEIHPTIKIMLSFWKTVCMDKKFIQIYPLAFEVLQKYFTYLVESIMNFDPELENIVFGDNYECSTTILGIFTSFITVTNENPIFELFLNVWDSIIPNFMNYILQSQMNYDGVTTMLLILSCSFLSEIKDKSNPSISEFESELFKRFLGFIQQFKDLLPNYKSFHNCDNLFVINALTRFFFNLKYTNIQHNQKGIQMASKENILIHDVYDLIYETIISMISIFIDIEPFMNIILRLLSDSNLQNSIKNSNVKDRFNEFRFADSAPFLNNLSSYQVSIEFLSKITELTKIGKEINGIDIIHQALDEIVQNFAKNNDISLIHIFLMNAISFMNVVNRIESIFQYSLSILPLFQEKADLILSNQLITPIFLNFAKVMMNNADNQNGHIIASFALELLVKFYKFFISAVENGSTFDSLSDLFFISADVLHTVVSNKQSLVQYFSYYQNTFFVQAIDGFLRIINQTTPEVVLSYRASIVTMTIKEFILRIPYFIEKYNDYLVLIMNICRFDVVVNKEYNLATEFFKFIHKSNSQFEKLVESTKPIIIEIFNFVFNEYISMSSADRILYYLSKFEFNFQTLNNFIVKTGIPEESADEVNKNIENMIASFDDQSDDHGSAVFCISLQNIFRILNLNKL